MLKEIMESEVLEGNGSQIVEKTLQKAIITLETAAKQAKKYLPEGDRLEKELNKLADATQEELMFVQKGEYS